MDYSLLQKQIDSLNERFNQMESSNSLSREIETSFRERLQFQFIPFITIGIAAPTVANVPKKAGDVYVDNVNHKIYIADNNLVYTDYKILN